MKKSSLLFFALFVLIFSPLSILAYESYPYIPSEPLGSKNNPIIFQEVKTQEQMTREMQQRINESEQRANDVRNKLLQDAWTQDQLPERSREPLPQNSVQYVPVYVPSTPTPQQENLNKCPANARSEINNIGTIAEPDIINVCVCRLGYKWSEDRTTCVQNFEEWCHEEFSPRGTWNGTVQNGIPSCSCRPGYREIETGYPPPFLQCLDMVPERRGFWAWLRNLFSF